MKRITELSFSACLLFACASSVHANGSQRIDPVHTQHPDHLRGTIYTILQPRENEQIVAEPWKKIIRKGATDIRIRYSSLKPVPVQLAPLATGDKKMELADFLFALLPAASSGDVLISVTSSPLWTESTEGIVVEVYGLYGSQPSIHGIEAENNASPTLKRSAYVQQFFRPTWFYLTSENFLYGYRIVDIPVTYFFAVIFAILSLLLFALKRDLLKAVSFAAIITIALFHARFMKDLTMNTFSDALRWNNEGTFSEMADTFAVSNDLKKETEATSLAYCGDNETPLQYFVYPHWFGAWETSSLAVLTSAQWFVERNTIYCVSNNTVHARSGSILKTYPHGWALARFSSRQ